MRENRNGTNIVDINQFKRRRDSRSRDGGKDRRPGRAVPAAPRSAARSEIRSRDGQAPRAERQRSASTARTSSLRQNANPPARPRKDEPRRVWKVQNPGETEAREKNVQSMPSAKRWTLIGMALLTVVLAVTGVYLTLSGTLFSVQQVEFAGVVTLDQGELMEMTGIGLGDNLLALDTGKVAEHLEAHPMLDVIRVDRRYPHTVYIQIREREPWAVIESMGNFVVLDEDMTVMAVRSELPAGQYPLIVGVIPVEYEPGTKIALDDAPQQKAMEDLLLALYAEDAAELIDTVDMTNAQNITMQAENGIRIVVGDTELVDNKAMWIAKMLPRLTQQGYLAGTLRVGSGRDFSFIPEGVQIPKQTPAPTSVPAETVAPEETPAPAE